MPVCAGHNARTHAHAHLSLLLDADSLHGTGEEGRTAAGNERDDKLSLASPLHQRERRQSRSVSRSVWEVVRSSLKDPAREKARESPSTST